MDSIVRLHKEGLHIVTVDRGSWTETYVCGFFVGTESLTEKQLSRLCALIDSDSSAHIRFFGGDPALPNTLSGKLISQNVTIDRFESPQGKGITTFVSLRAVVIKAKPGTKLQHRKFENNSIGWILESPGTRMGYLFGVKSQHPAEKEAYHETYENTILNLQKMGFEPADLTRTWCYFRDILKEYRVFNEERKILLEQHGIYPKALLPASTGIQGIAETGELLTMDALAFSGPKPVRKRVLNPGQCEAPEYGSFFSRGIEVQGLGPRQLLVSGLSSVGENGETLYRDDPVAQVDVTIDKAKNLMDEGGYKWSDCVSGVIYIKPQHHAAILKRLPKTPIHNLPFALAFVDVCRHDLLFEIEFMAFKNNQ